MMRLYSLPAVIQAISPAYGQKGAGLATADGSVPPHRWQPPSARVCRPVQNSGTDMAFQQAIIVSTNAASIFHGLRHATAAPFPVSCPGAGPAGMAARLFGTKQHVVEWQR